MRSIKSFAVCGATLLLTGCAIHPLPDDVTGISTYDIVRQIRCEARQAIFDSAVGWLTHDQKVDTESRRIGLEFADHQRPIQSLSPNLFKGRDQRRVRELISTFYQTGIAYNFNLQMTEDNNVDPVVNLLKPMHNAGKFTANIAGKADRQRQNTRIFTVTDTFDGLIQHIRDDYCTDYIVQENYIYPIAGKIGIKKLVQDFIELSLFGNLAGPKDKPTGPPTMVDTLMFTTTFSLGVTPVVTFTPINNALQVTDASLPVTAKRTDVHTVTVGLALAGAGIKQIGPLRTALFGPLLTAQGGASELAAAEAINQALTLRVFQPTIIVTP